MNQITQAKQDDLPKLKSVPTYAENPFLNGQLATVRPGPMRRKSFSVAGSSAGQTLVSPSSEVIPNGISHTAFTYVEESHFAKVYIGAIAHLYDLTHAQFKILLACIEHLGAIGQLQGIAILTEANSGLTKNTFNLAIRGLIAKGVLARCALIDGAYFVHPQFVFKGDRARFIMEFRKKKTKDDPSQLSLFDSKTGKITPCDASQSEA